VFCSFLAFLLKTELERRMKFADLKCEWAQIIRGLEALQQVEATLGQTLCFTELAYQRGFSGDTGDRRRRSPHIAANCPKAPD
jgi:hypothetical protein